MTQLFQRTYVLLAAALLFSGSVAFQANGAAGNSAIMAETVGKIAPKATGSTIELLHEDFESWPPTDWNIVNNGGNCVWSDTATIVEPNYAGGDGNSAIASSDECGFDTTMDTELQSPVLNLAYAETASLSYVASYFDIAPGGDFAEVLVSDNGGTSWTTVLSWDENHDPNGPGEEVTIDLTAFAGSEEVIVSFRYYAPGWDWWFQVDQVVVTVTTPTSPQPPPGLASTLLYDNGNPATRYEVGSGAANVSEVQTGLGLSNNGYGNQAAEAHRVADDFTIEDGGGWDIEQISFYGYQNGSGTTSSFTAVNLQIWDGPPDAPGSAVVWGNTSSNVMVSSHWSGIYKAKDIDLTDTLRPIMLNTVAVNTHLAPGTYWLDWQADGSSMLTGPWVPLMAVTGETTTGNGLQSLDGGATWGPAVDLAALTNQGFPFRISGSHAAPVLFSNGPLVNLPDGGSGLGEQSVLQNTRLGMGTYGFGHQVANGNRIADDFTISSPSGWRIEEIILFAYQTLSPTTSSLTAVNLKIWDGPPGDPASTVVWGDDSSNVMASSDWSGIYRVKDDALGDTLRPIMANTLSVNTLLPQGTYWLDWQTDGSLASGPWAPPITLNGQQVTGNALQSSMDNGITWNPVTDFGGTGVGFPFVIKGNINFPWPMFMPAIIINGQ